MGPPSVIRSGKGAASPSHAGAMALPGAVTAPEPCPQATGPVPWPPPGTRRPWQVAPTVRISCGALLPCQAGRSTSPRDDARAHQHLPAGRTPLRMRVPHAGHTPSASPPARAPPPAVAQAQYGRRRGHQPGWDGTAHTTAPPASEAPAHTGATAGESPRPVRSSAGTKRARPLPPPGASDAGRCITGVDLRPVNWLRVFRRAEASRMGQGGRQQRQTQVVPSEKCGGLRG